MSTSEREAKRQIEWVIARLEKHFGEPVWPGRRDFLEILIGTILSQNTNDKNSEAAFLKLRAAFKDWQAIMASPTARIAAAIRSAGLANQKAERIKKILAWVNKTWGTFDLNFLCAMDQRQISDLFQQQKGIGAKTISVTLMFACGHDVFPVDTHVHRLCGRLGLVPSGTTAEKTFTLMAPRIHRGKGYSFHVNKIRLGREICQARKPRCLQCPLRKKCPSAPTSAAE